jgi:hypothetical protein
MGLLFGFNMNKGVAGAAKGQVHRADEDLNHGYLMPNDEQ